MSVGKMSGSDDRPVASAQLRWLSGVFAGVLAGVVIGWAVRGTVGSRNVYVPPVHESRGSGPPSLLQEQGRLPFTLQQPDTEEAVPSKSGGVLKRENTGSKGSAASVVVGTPGVGKDGSLQPMPLPMPGAINNVSPAVVTPLGDLHSLEAKLRVIASESGGKIVSTRDAKGSSGATVRSVVVSMSPEKVKPFTERVGKALGTSAMVEDPVSTPDAESEDSLKAAQIKNEESVLAQLKLKLHQAQLDFYPDASALKAIEAQYGEELKKVNDLRGSIKSSMTVTVLLAVGQ